MKKLLILGGADQHIKLVKAAKEMGVHTIVLDYLDDTIAKRLADESYQIDIFDVDRIVEFCKADHVDAVLSTSLDPCQRPYQAVCERLGLPCFCTYEQVLTLTDKHLFRQCCIDHGVDVIESFDIKGMAPDEIRETVSFPVFVKPAHCRGSRGQSICYSVEDLLQAVPFAESASDDHTAIVEKYMGNHNDFTMTYMFIDGEAHLIKMSDRYLGTVESGMDRNCIASVSPSRYAGMYLKNVDRRIVAMLKDLGIQNGPVFMQGFVDGDTVRFYDPGFRFPGAEYETLIKHIWGVDLMKMMVEFSLTGHISVPADVLHDGIPFMRRHAVGTLVPTIRAGRIGEIKGFDQIEKIPQIICYTVRHQVGDVIHDTHDVDQFLCEFDLACASLSEYRSVIRQVQGLLEVYDDQGEDMLCSVFDTEEMKEYAFGDS